MAYQKDRKLGLVLKSSQNRVIVARTVPESLSSRRFEPLDQILDIESQPVTDAEVARAAILQSMQTKGYFTSIIARPTTPETRKQMTETLNKKAVAPPPDSTPLDEPSVKMAPDVRDIAKQEMDRIAKAQVSRLASPPISRFRQRPERRLWPHPAAGMHRVP